MDEKTEETVKWNQTTVTEFVLLGFTEHPTTNAVLFGLFLAIYLATLVGNIGIIVLIWFSPCLHSPMYFFLNNLAFLDFSYSSAITPKMLVNFLIGQKTISLAGCITQMYVFAALADAECLLLAAMAYDRFMAICNPLLYPVLMSHRVCFWLVAGSYLTGSVTSLIHTYFTFHLPFCRSNVINHFFCDIPPLLALSCSSTRMNEIFLFALCGFIQTSTFVFIATSYTCILCAILRINSSEGRQKAFSTCASHLTAVVLYYGALLFTYLRPSSSYILNTDKVIAVFYTMVFPLLNPLIYSLRNEEVKSSFNKLMQRKLNVFRKIGRSSQSLH